MGNRKPHRADLRYRNFQRSTGSGKSTVCRGYSDCGASAFDGLCVSLHGPFHDERASRFDRSARECTVNRLKSIWLHRLRYASHSFGVERNEVRIAAHEAHILTIEGYLHRVAHEQSAPSVFQPGTVKHRAASEVAVAADHRRLTQLQSFTVPRVKRRPGFLHPFAVIDVEMDRHAATGLAPLDHRRIEMRVRNHDCRKASPLQQFGLHLSRQRG